MAAMVASGQMTPDEAQHSPDRNKVLRSLGSLRVPQDNYVQTLDAPLGDLGLGGANRIVIRQAVVPDGRPAVTDFRVVERRGAHTLIEAYPRSGRLHQIRAHLSHLGLPMVGDKIYGLDPDVFLDFMQTGQTPELTARLGLARACGDCRCPRPCRSRAGNRQQGELVRHRDPDR